MSLEQTAQRLIQQRGRSVTVVAKSTQPPDATKPWRPVSGSFLDTQITLKAVFTDETDSELVRLLITQGAGRAPRDQPRRGKRSFLVAALDVGEFPIDKADKVEDGTEQWRVTSVNRVQPGEIAYIYELGVEL